MGLEAYFGYLGYPLKWILNQFGWTKVILEDTQVLEWSDNSLLYEFRFRERKPRVSLFVCNSQITLQIPQDMGLAEFEIEIPAAHIGPIKLPLSRLSLSAKEILKNNDLNRVQNNQVIPVALRIPSKPQDVLKIYPETQISLQIYRIKNHNRFAVRQCDMIFPIFIGQPIQDIQIIKLGNVERTKLIKIKKTFGVDFEVAKMPDKFPEGILVEDNKWLGKETTAAICEIQMRLDFEPDEEIEVRLIY